MSIMTFPSSGVLRHGYDNRKWDTKHRQEMSPEMLRALALVPSIGSR